MNQGSRDKAKFEMNHNLPLSKQFIHPVLSPPYIDDRMLLSRILKPTGHFSTKSLLPVTYTTFSYLLKSKNLTIANLYVYGEMPNESFPIEML